MKVDKDIITSIAVRMSSNTSDNECRHFQN